VAELVGGDRPRPQCDLYEMIWTADRFFALLTERLAVL